MQIIYTKNTSFVFLHIKPVFKNIIKKFYNIKSALPLMVKLFHYNSHLKLCYTSHKPFVFRVVKHSTLICEYTIIQSSVKFKKM